MNARERLKAGIHKFKTEVYPERREAYERAATEPQRPHTLVVTCADSRIDPELITQSGPGEIFVTRNIGNLVPPYGEMLGGVSAVLEYAVNALGVQHVVICGHTDCGAMKAMLNPQSLEKLQVVRRWLRNAESSLEIAREMGAPDSPGSDSRDFLMKLTQQNVLMQMAHARTHPSVAGAAARGELELSGWVYQIGSGEILIYDEAERRWEAAA